MKSSIKKIFIPVLLLAAATAVHAQNCSDAAARSEAEAGDRQALAGDFAAAALSFDRASVLAPRCLDYRVALAASLERSGRPEEAASTLERAGRELYLREGAPEAFREMSLAARELRRGSAPVPEEGGRARGECLCASGRRAFDASETVFSFVQISDLHVGEWMHGGSADTERLSWMVEKGFPALKPAFMVATGDLTDSTNGFIIPMFGPFRKEWDKYAALVAALPAGSYYDLPGNHDNYGDKDFRFYLANSVSRQLQHSWTVEADGKLYQFIAVNTAADDGGRWPGDDAGLRDAELDWLEAAIRQDAYRVVVFGHHPPHRLKYGLERFKAILAASNASYFCGHSHKHYMKTEEGRLEINLDSLGKDKRNNYVLASYLRGGDLCVRMLDAGALP